MTVYTTRSNMQGTEISDLYQSTNCPGFAQDFRDPVPLKLLRDYTTPVGAAPSKNRVTELLREALFLRSFVVNVDFIRFLADLASKKCLT